ncbi:MAG: YARHG domain-containing protein [Ignavibacteria bacterium]|nr:YARHG domain-containing protein [Ignavibacteria bacterium]
MFKNKAVKLLILSGVIFSMLHIASCTQKQESLSNDDQIKKEEERKKKEEKDLKYKKLKGLKDREYSALARIYPESSEDQLTYPDIKNLNEWELKVMRNEIYAQHGYIFKTEVLKKYFSAQK